MKSITDIVSSFEQSTSKVVDLSGFDIVASANLETARITAINDLVKEATTEAVIFDNQLGTLPLMSSIFQRLGSLQDSLTAAPNLRFVRLRGNELGENAHRLNDFCLALGKSKTLTSLDLSNNNLSAITIGNLQTIFRSLFREAKSITRLDLSENDFTPEQIAAINACVPASVTLNYDDTLTNEFFNPGITELALAPVQEITAEARQQRLYKKHTRELFTAFSTRTDVKPIIAGINSLSPDYFASTEMPDLLIRLNDFCVSTNNDATNTRISLIAAEVATPLLFNHLKIQLTARASLLIACLSHLTKMELTKISLQENNEAMFLKLWGTFNFAERNTFVKANPESLQSPLLQAQVKSEAMRSLADKDFNQLDKLHAVYGELLFQQIADLVVAEHKLPTAQRVNEKRFLELLFLNTDKLNHVVDSPLLTAFVTFAIHRNLLDSVGTRNSSYDSNASLRTLLLKSANKKWAALLRTIDETTIETILRAKVASQLAEFIESHANPYELDHETLFRSITETKNPALLLQLFEKLADTGLIVKYLQSLMLGTEVSRFETLLEATTAEGFIKELFAKNSAAVLTCIAQAANAEKRTALFARLCTFIGDEAMVTALNQYRELRQNNRWAALVSVALRQLPVNSVHYGTLLATVHPDLSSLSTDAKRSITTAIVEMYQRTAAPPSTDSSALAVFIYNHWKTLELGHIASITRSSPAHQLQLLALANAQNDGAMFHTIFSELPFAIKNVIFTETELYAELRQSNLLKNEIMRDVANDRDRSAQFQESVIASKNSLEIMVCIERLQLAYSCLGEEFSGFIYNPQSGQRAHNYLAKMSYYCAQFETRPIFKPLTQHLLAQANNEGLTELTLTERSDTYSYHYNQQVYSSVDVTLRVKLARNPLFIEMETNFVRAIEEMDPAQFANFIRTVKSRHWLVHPSVFNKVCSAAADTSIMQTWLSRQFALGTDKLRACLVLKTRDSCSYLQELLRAANRVNEWKVLFAGENLRLALEIMNAAHSLNEGLIEILKKRVSVDQYIATILAGLKRNRSVRLLEFLVLEVPTLPMNHPDFIAILRYANKSLQGNHSDYTSLCRIINKVCEAYKWGPGYAELLLEINGTCEAMEQKEFKAQLRPYLIQALGIEQIAARYTTAADATDPNIVAAGCFNNILNYFSERYAEAMSKGGLESEDGKRYMQRLTHYIDLHKYIRGQLQTSGIHLGATINTHLDTTLPSLTGWGGLLMWKSQDRYRNVVTPLSSLSNEVLRRRFEEMEERLAVLGNDVNAPHPFRTLYNELNLGTAPAVAASTSSASSPSSGAATSSTTSASFDRRY